MTLDQDLFDAGDRLRAASPVQASSRDLLARRRRGRGAAAGVGVTVLLGVGGLVVRGEDTEAVGVVDAPVVTTVTTPAPTTEPARVHRAEAGGRAVEVAFLPPSMRLVDSNSQVEGGSVEAGTFTPLPGTAGTDVFVFSGPVADDGHGDTAPAEVVVSLAPAATWTADNIRAQLDGSAKEVVRADSRLLVVGPLEGDEWYTAQLAWSEATTVFVNSRRLPTETLEKIAQHIMVIGG